MASIPADAQVSKAMIPFDPARCPLIHDHSAPWHRKMGAECRAERSVDGKWIVMERDDLVSFDATGAELWRKPLTPLLQKCGAPAGHAVAHDGGIVIGCGYSVLRYSADGKLMWQVFPAGDYYVTSPLVAADGTTFVGARGSLYAIDRDGKTKWNVDTGSNRSSSSLTSTPNGEIMFETSMAGMHSPTDAKGRRRYYIRKPNEILVVSSKGKIVSRTNHDDATAAFPAWLDVVGTGGGRM
jgi:outer membrane protein assembly factor BamB